MPEELKKVNAEIVESLPIDDRLIKSFEKIAEKTYLQIQREIIEPHSFKGKKLEIFQTVLRLSFILMRIIGMSWVIPRT